MSEVYIWQIRFSSIAKPLNKYGSFYQRFSIEFVTDINHQVVFGRKSTYSRCSRQSCDLNVPRMSGEKQHFPFYSTYLSGPFTFCYRILFEAWSLRYSLYFPRTKGLTIPRSLVRRTKRIYSPNLTSRLCSVCLKLSSLCLSCW